MSSREQKKLQTRHAFFNAVLDLCMTGQSFSSISLRQVTQLALCRLRFIAILMIWSRSVAPWSSKRVVRSPHSAIPQIGRKRSFDRQIAKSIQLFLYMVSDQPYYWQFLVSERYGGSESVRKAINELVKNMPKAADDLALQPAFTHINDYDRRLLAEAGVNMFFSWIIDWLELTYTEDHDDEIDLNVIEENKQLMLHNCTRQAQMFYGAYNWKSSEETRLRLIKAHYHSSKTRTKRP